MGGCQGMTHIRTGVYASPPAPPLGSGRVSFVVGVGLVQACSASIVSRRHPGSFWDAADASDAAPHRGCASASTPSDRGAV